MTEGDYSTFATAFGRVCGAFGKKGTRLDQEELTRTYFRVLDAHPLDAVIRTGRRLVETGRKFPLAVDWLDAVTRPPTVERDVRQMTTSEVDAYAAAERARWTGQPCRCRECVRAGVDDRELRYVPTLKQFFGDLADATEETAFNPRRKVEQIVGHWAHGEELARWYAAREAFVQLPQFQRVARVLPLLRREPGQEG
jgi:hypothetical protein